MRNNKRILGLLLFVLATAFPLSAQTGAAPEKTLKDFYRWYIHELNASREPRAEKSKINPVVSIRLSRWLSSKAGREWDADYFIDAQDFDAKWENGITVSKPTITGNKADVKVVLSSPDSVSSGFSPHTLRIKMVKESGSWKIDRVNGY
jgi:hypothetical protein